MTPSDEIVKVEEFEIERFMALGLGRYDAIRAVEEDVDWRAVEALLESGSPMTVALESSRRTAAGRLRAQARDGSR